MRGNRFTAAVGALLLISIFGCGSSESDSTGGLEKDSLTIAALPLLDVAALHIADERKMFEAEGLKVDIQPIATSLAALPALKNGQLDVIAGANYVTFLQAHQQGTLKLRILAAGAAVAPKFMQVVVKSGAPLRSVRDLAGHTVAVNILNNIQSLTLNEILSANGVDPATVKYRAVPFPVMDKALANGDVDAVHTAEPFGTVIQKKVSGRMLIDAGQAPVTGLPVSGYIGTEEFVTKYPRTAAAFRRAIEKAQAVAADDPAAVQRVLPGYAKVDAATAATLCLPAYPRTTGSADLQRLADLMVKQGLLKSSLDVGGVILPG